MANSFVVAEINLETNQPIKFWSDNSLQEDLQGATLFDNRADGRLVFGQLQSTYPEKEFVLLAAQQQIILSSPPAATGEVILPPTPKISV